MPLERTSGELIAVKPVDAPVGRPTLDLGRLRFAQPAGKSGKSERVEHRSGGMRDGTVLPVRRLRLTLVDGNAHLLIL